MTPDQRVKFCEALIETPSIRLEVAPALCPKGTVLSFADGRVVRLIFHSIAERDVWLDGRREAGALG